MKMHGKMLLNMSGEMADIVEDNEDEMLVIIRCPNCDQLTEYGNTRMISGYVGCDNDYKDGKCFWDDLRPRIDEAWKTDDEELKRLYREGKLYSKIMKGEK